MRRKITHGGTLLAVCLAIGGLPSALADTTTTITTEKTDVVSPSSLLLPSANYVVVDPLSGVIRGSYTSGTRTLDGLPLTNSYVIMDKASRKVVATFDENGNLIGLNAAPAAPSLIMSLDAHRLALEKQIDLLFKEGQITASQADGLRLELANVFPNQATAEQITYARALSTDSGLVTVESHLTPFTPKSYTTIITPTFLALNGQIILPDDLTRRKYSLERKMNDDFNTGRITQAQLLSLKLAMNEIYNREASYRVTGLMNDHDAALLAADLDSFQARLDQSMASH